MATRQPDLHVAHLLVELRSGDFVRRLAAVKALGAAKVNGAEVIGALKAAAETDSSAYVREAALSTLTALGVAVGEVKAYVAPRVVATPLTRREKIRAWAIGFVGWNLIVGLLWVFTGWIPMYYFVQGLLLLLLPGNLLVLIGLAFTRRWVALGMLAALALNAVVFTLITAGSIFYMGVDWVSLTLYVTPFWALYFPN